MRFGGAGALLRDAAARWGCEHFIGETASTMLNLKAITLRIADRVLLDEVTLFVPAGQRCALVGRNGTGKTTLFRLIAGDLAADHGECEIQNSARIGWIAQEAPGGERTPLEHVLAADTERQALLDEREADPDPIRLAEIEGRWLEIGADRAPARAAKILKGLGFDHAGQNAPLTSFSGGWRMRASLAAVLFAEPDLLLLDEPTNHLDLEASIWLEDHLKRYPRTLILISHDRDLLNSVPERIIHLENRKLTAYGGNYDTFEKTRRLQQDLLQQQRAKQEAKRKHMQAFVDRFRYKASKAKQAQSRIKMLEKLEPLPDLVGESRVVFQFPNCDVPPPPMITLNNASAGYGDTVVLKGLAQRIDPDDRIALLGANGNGKSTFAKLIAGRLQALSGEVVRANNLKVGFFAQHQIEDLTPDATALAHMEVRRPGERAEKLRGMLAQFGLIGDRALTEARHLSGGEKTRLAMTLMCLDAPQILILDEPTNHLDIDSRQALIEAVNAFPGAVILISHDRHLVELTADRLWLVEGGKVTVFSDDLEAYRQSLLEKPKDTGEKQKAVSPAPPNVGSAERRKLLAPLRKQAKAKEREVEKLAAERATIDATLADPASYQNGTDIKALQRRSQELGDLIDAAELEWLEIEAEIEAI